MHEVTTVQMGEELVITFQRETQAPRSSGASFIKYTTLSGTGKSIQGVITPTLLSDRSNTYRDTFLKCVLLKCVQRRPHWRLDSCEVSSSSSHSDHTPPPSLSIGRGVCVGVKTVDGPGKKLVRPNS